MLLAPAGELLAGGASDIHDNPVPPVTEESFKPLRHDCMDARLQRG